MADSLEIKKVKAELARVTAAKLEMDMRVEERTQEIERLKEHMTIQEAKEQELAAKLEEMSKV